MMPLHLRRFDSGFVALFSALLIGATVFDACASPSQGGYDIDGGSDDDATLGGLSGVDPANIDHIEVLPAPASLDVPAGTHPTLQFKAVAHLHDGGTAPLSSPIEWRIDSPQLGTISGGLFTASGDQGGVAKVSATYAGKVGAAPLTVRLTVLANPANTDPGTQAALRGASAVDPVAKWAYPYDGTVFPRGIAGPTLMWNGAQATDLVYVHVSSPTFDMEIFDHSSAPARVVLDSYVPLSWQRFVDSTTGAAKLKVVRETQGGVPAVVADHTWTIAPGALRGTVYYWAVNSGRILRLKPGAASAEDFATGPANAGKCMGCHTVSADGSTMVFNYGGTRNFGLYNLKTNAEIYTSTNADVPNGPEWAHAAVSPDGKYVLPNNTQDPPEISAGTTGLYAGATAAVVSASGFDGTTIKFPAFAPDGKTIAFIDGPVNAPGALRILDFDPVLGRAASAVSAARLLVNPGSAGASQVMAWLSVSADANWVVYQRGSSAKSFTGGQHDFPDSTVHLSDLYLANTKTAGIEMPLANLNGATYPFAAGDRDRHYNSFPTFAPVLSGGYQWVVFTSRRTLGNLDIRDQSCVTAPPVNGATPGPDIACTKQLWIAAIDQNPTPGTDPSHPAFWLPGQVSLDVTTHAPTFTRNYAGYFALEPCKGDGQGCTSGTECCGGFCSGAADGGSRVCGASASCAGDGDKCATTGDCCDAKTGTVCVNGYCAQPGPR
jgi:hypothetical protein